MITRSTIEYQPYQPIEPPRLNVIRQSNKITIAKSFVMCPRCKCNRRTTLDKFKCCDKYYDTLSNLCHPRYKRPGCYPLTEEQHDKMMQENREINRKNRKFRLITPSYFDINDL